MKYDVLKAKNSILLAETCFSDEIRRHKASDSSIQNLQTVLNVALHTRTVCAYILKIHNLHSECLFFPIAISTTVRCFADTKNTLILYHHQQGSAPAINSFRRMLRFLSKASGGGQIVKHGFDFATENLPQEVLMITKIKQTTCCKQKYYTIASAILDETPDHSDKTK